MKAELWVMDRTLQILFGEVGQVVKGIHKYHQVRTVRSQAQDSGRSHQLSVRNRTECAMTNTSPTAGFPIASGPGRRRVQEPHQRSDGAIRHALDRTDGPEAIVQLRAIYLSGDFDAYWQFHIEQDQRRLYPVPWTVVPK